MPPDPKQTQPPAPPSAPAAGSTTDDRLSAVEAEQARQGGMLEQILERLPGRGGQAPAPAADGGPAGKSVAEQVRAGIEALERERAEAAEKDANKTAREDHARRLEALEERSPAETAATPVGMFRAGVQRIVFGIDTPHR